MTFPNRKTSKIASLCLSLLILILAGNSAVKADGGKIAFNAYGLPDSNGTSEIVVTTSQGLIPSRLTNNLANDIQPSFNGDGSKLAFVSNRDSNNEIYVMNDDGSGVVRLTNTPTAEANPCFNQAGDKIAFVTARNGNNEIYVMNSDGGSPVRLTNTPASEGRPFYSPDGTKIVFSSKRDGNDEIYVMNADGSNPQRLTTNTDSDINPSFSPDGTKIIYVSQTPSSSTSRFMKMNSDGSNPMSLTSTFITSPDAVFSPVYGPHGDSLQYETFADKGINIKNRDGSQYNRITPAGWTCEWPTWSTGYATTTNYVYADPITVVEGNSGTKPAVFEIKLAEPALRSVVIEYYVFSDTATAIDYKSTYGQITFAPGEILKTITVLIKGDTRFELDEKFSLDLQEKSYVVGVKHPMPVATIINDDAMLSSGGKIAFVSNRDGNNEIYLMSADGSSQTNLTNSPENDVEPSWHPNAPKVVFVRRGANGGFIYVMNDDGSEAEALHAYPFPYSRFLSEPAYSPSSSDIVYSYMENGTYNILSTSSSGSPYRSNLITSTANDLHPRLSPDARFLAFHSSLESPSMPGEIFVADADGKNQYQLTSNEANDIDPSWNVDGSKIVFCSDRNGNNDIYVMNANGSDQTRLTFDGASDIQPCFSPDGSKIAFASNRDGDYEIYIIDIDGSNLTRLTSAEGDDTHPAWDSEDIPSALPTISITDVTAVEGQNAAFTVSLSHSYTRAVSVQFTTLADSAANLDYSHTYGTLEFAPGETEKIILVPTLSDELNEATEQFKLVLQNPLNGFPVRAQGVGSIVNLFVDDTIKLDLLIKKSTEADVAYALNDVYQSTPAGEQIETQTVNPGTKAIYNVRVQNDTKTAKSLVVKAVEGAGANWNIVYKLGSNDISSALRSSAGRTTATLAPGAVENLTLEVTPNSSVVRDVGKSVTFNVFNTGDAALRDSVQAITSAPPLPIQKPDAAIRTGAESEYSGDNVYSTTGAGQTKTQLANTATAALYYVNVQNDGNVAEAIKLKSSAAPSGWTLKYFNNETNAEITSAIIGSSGWNTAVLAPGATQVLRLEVKPSSSVAGGVKSNVTLTATSTGNTTIKDVVIATTEVQAVTQADAHIKKSVEADTAYALNDVYQSTPAGEQIEAQSVQAGQKATYAIRIQNDGNAARSFIVRATENGAGWSTTYKVSSNSVTAAIKAASGRATGVLAPGASEIVTAEMTAGAGLSVGSVGSTLFQVFNDAAGVSSNQVRDSVQAVTTVTPVRVVKIDASIRPASSATFIGDGAYNADGKDQTIKQTVARNTEAIYFVRVHNEGNTTEQIKINAPVGNSRWSVQYYNDASNADITSTVIQSAGWLSPGVAADASQIVRIEVTPNNTTPVGGIFDCLLRATSAADSTRKDTVKATTTAS